MVSAIGGSGFSTMAAQRPMQRPSPEAKFTELDVDESGSLGLDELQTMAQEISERVGMEISAEEMMDKLDADGNGTLELSEMPEPPPPNGPPPRAESEFSGINSNPLDSLLRYMSLDEEDSEGTSLELSA